MEIKKPIKIDYDKNELEEYKGKLATILLDEGIDTNYTLTNANAKNYIANWAKEHIVEKEMHYKLQGFTFRFATLSLGAYNSEIADNELRSFPIINKYKGHNLIETIYFVIDKDEVVSDKILRVKNNIITLN